ncbi:MAG TPA: hypothetical protein VFH39_04160 [Candidatus Saccharimonadales bacterium]|nr:hypothetical protein [Candidatus Saccharimonadales bacterium]
MSSRRQYIDQAYLTSYLSGQSLNSDYSSVDDLISAAEEFIDAYVGPQDKWFKASSNSNGVYTAPDEPIELPWVHEVRGRVATANSSTSFTLQQYQQNVFQMDFFNLCSIEIIGGTGLGQTNHITGSTYQGLITVEKAWTTPLDTTSVYRIYQLGKFPRLRDVYFDSINQPVRYYKTIPDGVRRAVAAQCVYMNTKGRDFFTSDAAMMTSEHLGSYSYTRRLPKDASTRELFIAPEAKEALSGIVRRTGRIRT